MVSQMVANSKYAKVLVHAWRETHGLAGNSCALRVEMHADLPTGFHLTTALNSEASWSSVQGSSGLNCGCAGAAGVGVSAATGVSMSIASSSRIGVAVLDGVAATWVLPRPPLFFGGMAAWVYRLLGKLSRSCGEPIECRGECGRYLGLLNSGYW